MNKICLALLLALLFFAPGAPAMAQVSVGRAPAQYSASELEKLWRPVGSKRRKQVTSNAFHFWAWSRNEADGLLGPYLRFEGVIIGDPHPRNVFDYRAGRAPAVLAVADTDDGGRGPLFLDFARYVTYLEAAKLDLKVGKIFEAYLAGLRGQGAPRAAIFETARRVSAGEIDTAHQNYILKNSREGRFNYEDLRMTRREDLSKKLRNESALLEEKILAMTGLEKVYDVGYRVNDSGSSAGMARFWFLLGNGAGPSRVLEAKELAPRAAVDYYQPQAADAERIAAVVAAYSSKGFDEKSFGVLPARSNYWVRPRKYQALKLDDEDISDGEIREFAFLVAHWMGERHAKQGAGRGLLRKIEQDPKAAKNAMESLVRAYLKEIKHLPE